MKIGIMTFHNAENYGAVLQSYALMTAVKKIMPQHEVRIIDYRNREIASHYKLPIKFSVFKHKSFVRNVISFCSQIVHFPGKLKKKSVFERFRKDFLSLAECRFEQFGIVLYGSDQIWNPALTGGDPMFFGANNSAAGKIAYAASDGNELTLSQNICSLLQEFSAVSCREKSLTDRLQKVLRGKKIETVCDPVFLLSKDEWCNVMNTTKCRCGTKKGFILVYKIMENDDIDKEAARLAGQLNKKIIEIVYIRSVKTWFMSPVSFKTGISPEDFMRCFAMADIVLTTSFHGTAFSIIFRKPFYVFSFSKRSERITDLLAETGLSGRFVSRLPDEITTGIYTSDVESRISACIAKSKTFLTEALHNVRLF